MKRTLSMFSVLILLAAVVATLNSGNVMAAGGGGYVISPVREIITVSKGTSQTVDLSIQNPTAGVQYASMVVNDFEASTNESGQPQILLNGQKSPINSFQDLVSKNLPSITIQPKQTLQIPIKITVPKNAEAGGYYGVIRVINGSSTSNTNIALAASVGTIFLVTVPGKLTENLQLIQFTAAKNGDPGRVFINSGPMSIITRLENTGNIHVAPFGTVNITDSHGKIVESYKFNVAQGDILPNSIRKFIDPLANTKWQGKYKISAYIGYGTTGSLITTQNTFWIIPAWFVISAIVIILILLILGFVIFRKITSNRKHKVRARF